MARGKVKSGETLEDLMKENTRCTKCGRILNNKNFYVSNSKANVHTKRMSICKDCLVNIYVDEINELQDIKLALYRICRLLDLVYLNQIYESSLIEAGWNVNYTLVQNGLEIWKKYIKTINSLKNYDGFTFNHGEQLQMEKEVESKEVESIVINKNQLSEEELATKIRDKQNRDDIVRIIGYDPFKNEKEDDKSYFYSRLVDMMTEDMQNDSNKLTSVISIIKSQKQVDKIDDAISDLMDNPITMVKNAGDIKLLTTTKKELQKSVLDTAKDNRISDLYSGQKTVGANTLTGISKKLKELNLDEAQVNLYDIQTSLGMYQVAQLSNKAINEQLAYAENEYADMVAWQRGKVQYFEKMYKQLAEENRKLKVLCNINNLDYKDEVFIETNYEDMLNYDEKIISSIDKEKEEFNELVKSVLPVGIIEYADKIIQEKEEIERQRLLESLIE